MRRALCGTFVGRSVWAIPAVLMLAAGGCAPEPQGGSGAARVEVEVAETEARAVPVRIEQVGRTLARRNVELRARVQAFLVEQLFQEGDRVREGQRLFRLDRRSFEADLKVAEAKLAQSRARLIQAERDFKRLDALEKTNAATARERDDAESMVVQATADVALFAAQVDKAKLDLSFTEITSPIDGIVGESRLTVGALLTPGANDLLAQVLAVDPIDVTFSLTEREGLLLGKDLAEGRVRVAGAAKPRLIITLANGVAYPLEGEISFVDPDFDPQSGTVRVMGKVPNPESKLKPGMFVRVAVVGLERPDAIMVPQRAVVSSPAGRFVYVVDGESKVAVRPVQLGDWSGNEWVVLRGLSAGERVVVSGTQTVRPGMEVTSRPAPTQPSSDKP
jgi:membrane fusion protein (multidrug efflux system)